MMCLDYTVCFLKIQFKIHFIVRTYNNLQLTAIKIFLNVIFSDLVKYFLYTLRPLNKNMINLLKKKLAEKSG